jgi:hypothetical protein
VRRFRRKQELKEADIQMNILAPSADFEPNPIVSLIFRAGEKHDAIIQYPTCLKGDLS